MKRKRLLFLWCWLSVLFFCGNGYAQSTTVVISQVYGGGGNTGAPYTHDFVELFNKSTQPITMTNWSVQYTSATGTSWGIQKAVFSGTIQPGGYFLVQLAGGTNGKALPKADATGNFNMGAAAGKIALVNSSTSLDALSCPASNTAGISVLDFVGFGTNANCFEGLGATAAPSNTTAVIRKDNGCADTNQNNVDFITVAPAPRNSTTVLNPCTSGAVIFINDVAVNEGNTNTPAAFIVTLSHPATTDVTFDIATQDGTATAGSDYTAVALTGQIIPAGSTSYTFAVPVTGDTQAEEDETFVVNITNMTGAGVGNVSATGTITNDDGAVITPIYTIQGSGTVSPKIGQKVTTTGVVVADYQGSTKLNGFYIQDATGDNNTATSDGIFVYDPKTTADVSVGQVVQVSGTVAEFSEQTQIENISNITVTNPGNVAITPVSVTLPVSSLGQLEQLEGMLVNVPQQLTVSQNFTLSRFGEVWLSAVLEYPFAEADGRLYNPTNFIDPTDTPASGVENDENNTAAVTAQQDLHNRASILLDDASSVQNPGTIPYVGPDNTLRLGSTVENLAGILSQGFNFYRLQPTQAPAFTYAPRPLAPPAVGAANVKIASFNVLNYFNGDGTGSGFPTSRGAHTSTEFTRQRTKIIAAITGLNADVVGLLEIENDGDGATSAIADLVRGLNEATSAGTYDYIRDPANGGTGTDAIKVAFIYKPGSVTPVGAAMADLNTVHNRPPLAQVFRSLATGEIVTAVINHFKSKGGTGSGTDADAGDGQGSFNGTRVLQAQALVNFVNATVIPAAQDPDVILLGDLNAYNEEDPIDVLRAAGFVNLFGPESYSYVFEGQSGSLDHALVTPSLHYQFTTGGKWHINADEPLFLDYNTEFKTAEQIAGLYQPNPFRSSDHDPVLVGLRLTTPTIGFATATASVEESAGTYTVQLPLSEATNQPSTITVSLTNGTGVVYGTDYTTTPEGAANSFTVTIPANSTMANFTLDILDDQIDELNEQITFAITQASGGVKIATPTTFALTIQDNDVPIVSFTQSGATTQEGAGSYTVTINASIAPITAQTITISINDHDFQYGTSKDYVTNPSGAIGTFTLTLPAGQTTVSFVVTPDKNLVSKKNSLQSIDFTISAVSAGAAIGTPQVFILAIADKKATTDLQISTYPNPVTTLATIKVENAGSGGATIALYDQAGTLVLSKNVTITDGYLETGLEVGQLKRGQYVLIVTLPNGTVRTHLLLN